MCSATFEQVLAFGATFCGSSNLEQILPFLATFEQNIGLEHISSTKKSTILMANFNFLNFFKTFFLTDVSNYWEELKIKLLINVYIKISRTVGGNFWNLGTSNFLDFWQLFCIPVSNFPAFYENNKERPKCSRKPRFWKNISLFLA